MGDLFPRIRFWFHGGFLHCLCFIICFFFFFRIVAINVYLSSGLTRTFWQVTDLRKRASHCRNFFIQSQMHSVHCVGFFLTWSRHDLSKDSFLYAFWSDRVLAGWVHYHSLYRCNGTTCFQFHYRSAEFRRVQPVLWAISSSGLMSGKNIISEHIKPLISDPTVAPFLCICDELRTSKCYTLRHVIFCQAVRLC